MTSEDQSVLIRGVGDAYVAISLYRVDLDCKCFKSPIVVGLVITLPIDGIDLLIGNDTAGDKVGPIVQNISQQTLVITFYKGQTWLSRLHY